MRDCERPFGCEGCSCKQTDGVDTHIVSIRCPYHALLWLLPKGAVRTIAIMESMIVHLSRVAAEHEYMGKNGVPGTDAAFAIIILATLDALSALSAELGDSLSIPPGKPTKRS